MRPREALQVARHVTECTGCRIVLARERRLAETLEGWSDAWGRLPIDESFVDRVMAELPPPAPPSAMSSPRERRRRGLRLLTLSLALLGGATAAGAPLMATWGRIGASSSWSAIGADS